MNTGKKFFFFFFYFLRRSVHRHLSLSVHSERVVEVINPLFDSLFCPRTTGWMFVSALPYHSCCSPPPLMRNSCCGILTRRVNPGCPVPTKQKEETRPLPFLNAGAAYGSGGGPAGCDAHCYSAARPRALHWGMPLSSHSFGILDGERKSSRSPLPLSLNYPKKKLSLLTEHLPHLISLALHQFSAALLQMAFPFVVFAFVLIVLSLAVPVCACERETE